MVANLLGAIGTSCDGVVAAEGIACTGGQADIELHGLDRTHRTHDFGRKEHLH